MAAYGVTKRFLIPVAFILLLIPCGWCDVNSCDVENCIHFYKQMYEDFFLNGVVVLCMNADEIIECSENCLELFFPDLAPIFSKTSLLDNFCTYEVFYGLKLHWDCISKHLHSVAYCISHIGSVTVETNSSEASQQLACQKIIDMIDCPEEALHECDSVAIDFINDAFKIGFKSLKNFYCSSVSLVDADDLPVNAFESYSLRATASCLDNMSPPEMVNYTSVCFDQYLRKAANMICINAVMFLRSVEDLRA
ncbi:hypothetical protein TNIN_410301 [Trichonephila inaurata madagascariensis]|uniref:Uncharacterized protein n=1 Tax=Trichonephila inaurata madagascariensis TaxID=2747483 RepID=A0A8X7C3E9_9ARAC|nr:hypothetical protein TNIN_410301 [Trichonephila inaurata madagascariensis]